MPTTPLHQPASGDPSSRIAAVVPIGRTPMIKPLLLAGLAVSILGSATAAHAHGDTRGDRNSSGRSGCETRSRYGNSRNSRRPSQYGQRYGNSGRRSYEYRGRWNDRREDYRGREHARTDYRDYDRDEDDRDWRDRADQRDDDRFDREDAPNRSRYELAPQNSGGPSINRRSPATGAARRSAL